MRASLTPHVLGAHAASGTKSAGMSASNIEPPKVGTTSRPR